MLVAAGHPFLLLNPASNTSRHAASRPCWSSATRNRFGSRRDGLFSDFQAAFLLRGCGLRAPQTLLLAAEPKHDIKRPANSSSIDRSFVTQDCRQIDAFNHWDSEGHPKALVSLGHPLRPISRRNHLVITYLDFDKQNLLLSLTL